LIKLERIRVPTIEHKVSFDKVFDGVTDHVKRHKVAYSFGAGVAVAGITFLIMRSTGLRGGPGISGLRGGPTNTASINFSNRSAINIINVLDREGRGHPGWPVRNLETKRVFLSQKEAADAFGVTEHLMSGHLRGKFDNIDGFHFERVNLVPTAA
jgi:hypothetical protein